MSHRAYGVLGENISYSLSPRIFEWAFRRAGIDGRYLIYDLPAEKARRFLLEQQDWDGLNVTIPHKEMAHECCDTLASEAILTGAVNTVHRGAVGIAGFNTDVSGFRFALQMTAGDEFRPRNCLIIGSGGAVRAVLLGLSAAHSGTRVEIASRNPQQAAAKLAPLMQALSSFSFIEMQTAVDFLRDFDLVVQATPVGSARLPFSPLPEPMIFKPDAVVIDLVYAPRKTRFLESAERSGARTQNGLPMLIAQAAESFRVWTGKDFPVPEAMKELWPELAVA